MPLPLSKKKKNLKYFLNNLIFRISFPPPSCGFNNSVSMWASVKGRSLWYLLIQEAFEHNISMLSPVQAAGMPGWVRHYLCLVSVRVLSHCSLRAQWKADQPRSLCVHQHCLWGEPTGFLLCGPCHREATLDTSPFHPSLHSFRKDSCRAPTDWCSALPLQPLRAPERLFWEEVPSRSTSGTCVGFYELQGKTKGQVFFSILNISKLGARLPF